MTSPLEPVVSDPNAGTGDLNPSGPNPAWNEVLSVIPAEYHGQITPHFQKWDQSAQSKIEEMNTKFKEYESYNPLLEHGINIDQVTQALLLNQEINTNPRAVYDALNQAYNFANGVVTPVADLNAPNVGDPTQQQIANDPRYDILSQQLDTVSQIIIQQEQAKAAAAADSALDQELTAAFGKFPDLKVDDNSEAFILTQMSRGMNTDQAVQSFVDFRNSLSPQPFAPSVMGSSGGGVPSNQIDPTKLSRQETRSLVADYITRMNANNT